MGKKICLTCATINELKLLKMVKIAFGSNDDLDILKDNYSLILFDNSIKFFWEAYKYSYNLNHIIE